MQQQKAASTPQWYVTAADSPTHGRRKQPKRPPTGEWTTNRMRFIHTHPTGPLPSHKEPQVTGAHSHRETSTT